MPDTATENPLKNIGGFCFLSRRYGTLSDMLSLHSISIVLLTLIFTFQASSVTVSALTDEDTAVHSLAELEIPAEIASQEIMSQEIAGMQSTTENTQLKMDIASLLSANREYSEQTTFLTSTDTNPENTTTIESIIINNRDTFDAFGDFLIGSGTGLLE